MSYASKIAVFAGLVAAALSSIPGDAMARGRLFPLTRCGPELAFLCPIHGYFDLPPFQYSLAIHPACIQVQRVETPNGIERRRVVVCG